MFRWGVARRRACGAVNRAISEMQPQQAFQSDRLPTIARRRATRLVRRRQRARRHDYIHFNQKRRLRFIRP